jgi:micrococcal nuclease
MLKPHVVIALVALAGVGGFLAGRTTAPRVPLVPPAAPIDTSVTVVRVGDGDTIEVAPKDRPDRTEKVRLLGIDAPGKTEKFYAEATKALEGLVGGKTIELQFEAKGLVQRDDSNRVLAYVIVEGVNANVEVVRQGWCELSSRHGGGRFADELKQAEDEARAAKSGIWQGT